MPCVLVCLGGKGFLLVLKWDGLQGVRGFPGGSDGKESDCNVGDPGQSEDREDPLEKGLAIHSSIVA